MSEEAINEEKREFLEATGGEAGDAMDETEPAAGGEAMALPPVDPANLEGEIVAAGSSTVFPLSERMAELFNNEGFGGEISVASIGSGAGFERFCVNAETDISNASRPINEDETQACQENGRDPVEFQVGIDAIAVTVSQENDFVEDVTLEELGQIFTTAETWADVRPEWPEEEIQRFSPGTDSGTFDFFVEEVLDENEEPLLQASNLQLSEDDNILAQGVIGSPYGIGYFGYAYYDENQDQLKALSLNGIEPSAESAESGEYPLSRPLFMYSTPQIMQEKPQVAGFLNYVLTNVNEEIRPVGYFPMSEEAINEEKREFLEATGQ
jgi:phosphate transport system substrate-binding protein